MEEGKSGKGGRVSVIFVIDLRSHFGAIDYVDENDTVYIADSTNEILWQVAMEDINAAIDEEGESAKVTAENLMVEREVTVFF